MQAESVTAESEEYINKLGTAFNKLQSENEAYKKDMIQLTQNLKIAKEQKSSIES